MEENNIPDEFFILEDDFVRTKLISETGMSEKRIFDFLYNKQALSLMEIRIIEHFLRLPYGTLTMETNEVLRDQRIMLHNMIASAKEEHLKKRSKMLEELHNQYIIEKNKNELEEFTKILEKFYNCTAKKFFTNKDKMTLTKLFKTDIDKAKRRNFLEVEIKKWQQIIVYILKYIFELDRLTRDDKSQILESLKKRFEHIVSAANDLEIEDFKPDLIEDIIYKKSLEKVDTSDYSIKLEKKEKPKRDYKGRINKKRGTIVLNSKLKGYKK